MRSAQIESLPHVIQGTETGNSRNVIKDEPTDSRLLSVSGSCYIYQETVIDGPNILLFPGHR